MNDIAASDIAQGGFAMMLLAILWLIGREMVASQKAHTAEMQAQGKAAAERDAAADLRDAERHTAIVEALGEVREAIATRPPPDDFDDERTPVRGLRPVRNGKRP